MTFCLASLLYRDVAVWSVLGLFAALGLVALTSPQLFRVLSTRSSRWVDTNKLLETFDKPIDVDRYVLPFSRLLGVAVLLAVAVLAYLFLRYY